jgi:hypothetical protein
VPVVLPIVDVPVVPEVVVWVVPVVDVALVCVIIVPDVSVEVPDGIADVALEPVVAAVSVTEVPVVSLLVVFSFVSFLQAKAKTTSARMQRTPKVFFISFLSQSSRLAPPGRGMLWLLGSNRGASESKTPCAGAQGVEN